MAVLEYLTDNAASQPLVFVVSLRTEPPSPAAGSGPPRQRGRPGVADLHLDRLSEREVAEMITACRSDADADIRSRIVRVSDGVPLLVEELLASPGIPESITDMVRAKMEEFTDDERAVLEAAAVMGRHFDWGDPPPAAARTGSGVPGPGPSGRPRVGQRRRGGVRVPPRAHP